MNQVLLVVSLEFRFVLALAVVNGYAMKVRWESRVSLSLILCSAIAAGFEPDGASTSSRGNSIRLLLFLR